MEGLPPIASFMYHFQYAAVGSPSSVLTPFAGHLRSYKNAQNKTKAVIFTGQCELISVLDITT